MYKKIIPAFVAVMMLGQPLAAYAHGGATGIVKERMDAMEDMKGAMKTVSDMFKGKIPYEPVQVRVAAETINMHAGENLTKLFPEGSLDHPTEAKAEIWQDWDRFQHLSKELERISQGLYDAADNVGAENTEDTSASMMGMAAAPEVQEGAESFATMPVEVVFERLSDNCSACHTDYRVEKDK
ncbi:c-type cytochrome [Neptuniibacter sp. QD37_6]|uniref:c-type cytochrome n=1 Tax=Neptuniibacter sp. QD37_6 TaxID=3398210 RepID=UPI0039F4B83C